MADNVSNLFDDTIYEAIQEAIAKKIGIDAKSDESNAINEYINSIVKDPDKLSELLKKKSKSKRKRTVAPKPVSAEELNDAAKKYKTPIGDRIVSDVVLPVVGDTASAIGNSIAIKNSLLGNALQAMSDKGSSARREQFGASVDDIAAAYGAPRFKIRSGIAKTIGDTVANRTYTLADKEASEIAKGRALAQQQLDRPSASYYDYLNGVEHRNNSAGARGTLNTSGVLGTPSDARIKNIIGRLKGGNSKLTPEDIKDLIAVAGNMDDAHDYMKDGDSWDDDMLGKYAEHIKNYLYQYKPEACSIDPSIDPKQMQIGPMAQDIEEVNPACIVETPDGVKTVDTGKLALMNAGAIADLARKIEELSNDKR